MELTAFRPEGKSDLRRGNSVLYIFPDVDLFLQDSVRRHYGTEKFMDYGFMEAMMRSTTLPARDLWYSEGTINYYYGGQYFAVFLDEADWQ